MELWIRSQDKTTLIRSYEIYISEYGKGSYVIRAKKTSHILGVYKTMERALEVLDEIQNILKPTIITTGYECELKENIKDKTSFNLDMIPTKTEIQELSNVVYQMPEK